MNNMIKRIGLTGNIGSGKSTIAREFSRNGAMVYYSDIHTKRQMAKPEVLAEIIGICGAGILTDHIVDRAKLAHIIFNDSDKMDQVRKVLIPVIEKEFDEWCELFSDSICILESAIIIETNMKHMFDKVIVVCAEEETKINRAVERGTLSKEQVHLRLTNQLPQEELIKSADFVINNDGKVSDISWVVKSLMSIFEEC